MRKFVRLRMMSECEVGDVGLLCVLVCCRGALTSIIV